MIKLLIFAFVAWLAWFLLGPRAKATTRHSYIWKHLTPSAKATINGMISERAGYYREIEGRSGPGATAQAYEDIWALVEERFTQEGAPGVNSYYG